MREEIKIHEILSKHICTLKKASCDGHNKAFLSESKIKVVNFDKIPAEYCNQIKLNNLPRSNDALYISSNEEWFMIEFKNGAIDKSEIYRKFYDSIIMLIELSIIPNFQFAREHINYILVYNSIKYPRKQESKSRELIYNFTRGLAHMEQKLFEVEKFEMYLCKEAHTYSSEEFDVKFTKAMEKEEK